MLFNANICNNIADGLDIVSRAIRGINGVINPQKPIPVDPAWYNGNVNGNININMSRRDLPTNQYPYNAQYPSSYYMNQYPQYGYYQPSTNYVPGVSNPNYGMNPFNNYGLYGNNPYVGNMGMYSNYNYTAPLPTYTSPFQNSNSNSNSNTIYGHPSGGNYGY